VPTQGVVAEVLIGDSHQPVPAALDVDFQIARREASDESAKQQGHADLRWSQAHLSISEVIANSSE
jgi:hypothetical protein